ncbi:MAG: hypothetical protein FWC57_01235, partial [Endomicrobia bacterium]|nr:hypothetical protein [Endomicrobiia bacterium]
MLSKFNLADKMFHRPPMLLVDKIISSESAKGTTEFAVPSDCIFLDENGLFSRAAMVEVAAQSFAAHDIYQKTLKKSKVSKGFLVSARSFVFFSDAQKGDKLVCRLEKTDEIAKLHMLLAEILKNG